MKKTAFVLGGGSIKGAYQIGQMYALIQKGIYPDIITGISVGSLNGLLYTYFMGLSNVPTIAIESCVNFWLNNVKQPSDLIEKKSWFRIIREIITGKFTGMLKTSKLEQLVKDKISLLYVGSSMVQLHVGAVNMNSGQIEYVDKQNAKIKEFTLASTRIPIMMPTSKINGSEYYDGGLIDNAAIGKAIDAGADVIYVLTTHPETIKAGFDKPGNILSNVNRIMDIVVNNTLNNDIIEARLINELVDRGLPEKVKVELNILRPEKPIEIDIESFTEQDIIDMINKGKCSI
jgi:NTE family protein